MTVEEKIKDVNEKITATENAEKKKILRKEKNEKSSDREDESSDRGEDSSEREREMLQEECVS